MTGSSGVEVDAGLEESSKAAAAAAVEEERKGSSAAEGALRDLGLEYVVKLIFGEGKLESLGEKLASLVDDDGGSRFGR